MCAGALGRVMCVRKHWARTQLGGEGLSAEALDWTHSPCVCEHVQGVGGPEHRIRQLQPALVSDAEDPIPTCGCSWFFPDWHK